MFKEPISPTTATKIETCQNEQPTEKLSLPNPPNYKAPSISKLDTSPPLKTLETVKIETALWTLLRQLFLKMYKDFEGLNLSLSAKHLSSLKTYLKHSDKEIRKLVLLIITTRMKFDKYFRRAWLTNFPESKHKGKILLTSRSGSKKLYFFFSSIRTDELEFNQDTLFYYMSDQTEVNHFGEH